MKTSENINDLAVALIAARKTFTPALKLASNPHFKSKYVDLAGAVQATDDALTANDLVVIQSPQGQIADQSVTIVTRIIHKSGQWVESELTLPSAAPGGRYDAQSVGSAITYGRRYSYMAILGIAPEDDDGTAASQAPNKTASQPAAKTSYKEAAKKAAQGPMPGGFSYDGNTLRCVPVNVQERASKKGETFLAVKFNGKVEGKDMAFCFHKSLFDAIQMSLNEDAQFSVEKKGEFLNIADVLEVGTQKFRDGKPYTEATRGDADESAYLTDDDIPF